MISFDNAKTIAASVAVVAVGFLAYKTYSKVKGAGGAVVDTITALPGAAVEVANEAVTGGIVGIGEVVGIPRTNMTQCQKDLADGKTWDASFSCPAGTFLGSLFKSKNTNTDTGNGYDSSGQRAGVRYDSNGNVIGVY